MSLLLIFWIYTWGFRVLEFPATLARPPGPGDLVTTITCSFAKKHTLVTTPQTQFPDAPSRNLAGWGGKLSRNKEYFCIGAVI